MEASGRETDRAAEFLAKRLVGKAELARDYQRLVTARGVVRREKLARVVDPVVARSGRLVGRVAVRQNFRQHGNEATDDHLRGSFLAQVQRRDDLEKAPEPVVAV